MQASQPETLPPKSPKVVTPVPASGTSAGTASVSTPEPWMLLLPETEHHHGGHFHSCLGAGLPSCDFPFLDKVQGGACDSQNLRPRPAPLSKGYWGRECQPLRASVVGQGLCLTREEMCQMQEVCSVWSAKENARDRHSASHSNSGTLE